MRIGELLVREGLIGPGQLAEATRANVTPYRPLGEVCVGLGFVTRSQVRRVVEKYRKQIALGELLVRMGMVSPEKVREALAEQEATGKRLGHILRYRRSVAAADLAEALAIQLGVRKIAPSPGMADPLLLAQVTPDFLMRHRLVPLSRAPSSGGRELVTVLMEDPLDLAAIADLGKVFCADIEPAIPATLDLRDLLGEVCDPWGRYRVAPEAHARGDADQGSWIAFRPSVSHPPLERRSGREEPAGTPPRGTTPPRILRLA